MDEKEVVRLYVEELWTLRRIAEYFGSNHHSIRRILNKHNIPISAKQRRKPMTEDHKNKVVASRKVKGYQSWAKGLKMSEEFKRKNMKGKLKSNIDFNKYSDYERLLFLSKLTAKHKQHLAFNDAARESFLDRFYFDKQFNAVYDAWLDSGKNKWYYPSIDHKTPKANGGNFELDNLQFLTWFENRAKADMSQEEWEQFQRDTRTESELFIRSILSKYSK